MSSSENYSGLIRKIEWAIMATATSLLVIFHLIFLRHVGGFWRDEVHTVHLATMSSLAQVWDNLQYASFPILWLSVLRFWTSLTGGSEFWLRILGLIVGLALVGALWWNARSHSRSLPFFSLVLLGFSPTVIRYGDSVRAYGFGTFLILMTFGLIWKVVDSPNPRRIFLATLSAVLSVQCLYQNAVLLLAICAAGFTVCLSRGLRKRSLLVIGMGMIAAVSLLPYIPTIRGQQGWGALVEVPVNLSWLWFKLCESIEPSGPFAVYVWIGLIGIAVGSALFCFACPLVLGLSRQQKDLILFSSLTLITGVVGYVAFLKIVSYMTQPWYYIALLALIAVTLDASLAAISASIPGRIFRIVFVLFFIGLTVRPVWESVHMRHTNIDLIASKLQNLVSERDLVLVAPWYLGVTFERYYTGKARWMTSPPIGYHRIHRYDLIKKAMESTNSAEAVKPVLAAMSDALKSGNRVWLVGWLPFLPEVQLPESLPPAPDGESGWFNGPYEHNWALQVGYYIQTHASHGEVLLVQVDNPVSDFENPQVMLVQGWQ